MLSVRTNMLALNAMRQFNLNTKKNAKNTEKLSSGYKINRAADDAAGLSMSETMRRLIRGLQKGSENITEGISLIKVADAALGEIADMLQRINELSVKAYNGTNTQQDRQYIQMEVDQLLEEIGRTGETTTYNEIQILKWEPFYTKTVQVTADKSSMLPVTVNVTTPLPKWLSDGIDDRLEKHVGYENLTDIATGMAAQQDIQGTMITLKRDAAGNIERNADGTAKYIYYGPDYGNAYGAQKAEHAGTWTPSLSNNATAKISYAGLKQFNSIGKLYGGLLDLLGGGFGIPCGTCRSKQYGINFIGNTDDITVDEIQPYYDDLHTLDLDLVAFKAFTDTEGNAVNCFDKIKDLAKMQMEDTTLSDNAKQKQVKDLADEIAKALSKKTYELMSEDQNMKDHFTKSFLTSDYDIVVYDYRDDTALSSEHAADTYVRTWAQSKITYPVQYLEPGTIGTIDIPHNLYIVCSAQDSDDVSIELPFISLERLGLAGYNAAKYERIEEYGEAYKKKLMEWEASSYEETTSTKYKFPTFQMICEPVFINGEPDFEFERKQVGETEITVSSTIKKYPYDRPKAGDGDVVVKEWYEPDNNRVIKDALVQISMWRTNLGATQNRLEHTYNNNGNKEENLTSAESHIRDTDVAKEMVDFSNNNILQQAGASILTHANQDRQFVLNLLT